ncbi:MAG: purine-nucleoside phosphorylase, partial [Acidobacteriota bacterium]
TVRRFGRRWMLLDTRGLGLPELVHLDEDQAATLLGEARPSPALARWAQQEQLAVEIDGRFTPLATAAPRLLDRFVTPDRRRLQLHPGDGAVAGSSMQRCVVTWSEAPELFATWRDMPTAWPAFLAGTLRPRVDHDAFIRRFAAWRLFLCEGDRLVGHAYAAPMPWDGAAADLPETWNEAVERAHAASPNAVHALCLLGAEVLIMTNSSGSLHADMGPGSLVLVEDHLNLTGSNVLYGAFPESWGPQFPDMGQAYDPGLRNLIEESAGGLDIKLNKGVYAGLSGPTYETPAEVRMVRTLGGDLVGMSTVQEVIAAHHMGMRCACISAVSNPAAGVSDEVLDHADVLERGRAAGAELGKLIGHVLQHPELC